MYVYSCNALSARFFDVDRALNSYFMIMIMSIRSRRNSKRVRIKVRKIILANVCAVCGEKYLRSRCVYLILINYVIF